MLWALAGLAGLYLVACLVYQARHPAVELTMKEASAAAWPAGFLWGTATAAHQVEGGNSWNDWARFEEEPGRIARGEKSGIAADHWSRVAQDIGLMRELRANSYRLSLEWSRLEKREREWDEEAWAHYVDEVAQLRAAGIEPMVTLLHFTLPDWLAARGGATAADFPQRFARFAFEAGRRLGPQVRFWCTVNEPNVQMHQGYVAGIWPPGVKDPALATRAFAGLLRAHGAAAAALRVADADAQIGLAQNLIVFAPRSRWNLIEWIVAGKVSDGFNWAFYESIAAGRVRFDLPGFPRLDEEAPELLGSLDWVGINYYRRNLVSFSPAAPGMVEIHSGPGPQSDTGQEIYPEGLLSLLLEAQRRYGKPLYVTENGIADATGRHRPGFVRDHARAAQQAIAEGVDLRGFFHWSLIDNFEWSEGFEPRFGLYRVDRQTLERSPSPGSEEFRQLAQ